MCSMLRDPRRDDHTAWTATTPEVFTARTYATSRDYEPRLTVVREISGPTGKPADHSATSEPIPSQR